MASPRPTTTSAVSAPLSQSMRAHRGLFLTEGIVLSALGLAAILLPPLAGLASAVLLGWLFLLAGLVGLFATFSGHRAPGFGWSLLSALVALMVGVVLLWHPLQTLITLTFVLITFFIIDGVLTIILALAHRRELSGKWEWMMVNGVVDLFLAGVIISGLPGTLVWALGLIVGIDLLFGGASLIAMALGARKLPSR
jgi:uncharacterized membrane protein HdeD (DUF308 family)